MKPVFQSHKNTRSTRLRLSVLFAFFSISISIPTAAPKAQINPVTSLLFNKSASDSSAKKPVKPDSADQTSEQQLAKAEQQQVQAQKQLDNATLELIKLNNALADLPKTASENQRLSAMAATEMQQARVDFYSQINDSLKDLQRQTIKIIAAEDDRDKWTPPNGTPPWPLFEGDEVLTIVFQLRSQLQKLDRHLNVLDRDLADQKKNRSQVEIDVRQASTRSAADQTSSAGDAAVRSSVQSIKDKLERIDLELARTDLERTIVLAQRRLTSIQLSTYLKTWQYYDHRFTFTADDLKKLTSAADNKIINLRKQEEDASVQINQFVGQAKTAKTQLDQIEATPNSSAAAILTAKQNWLKTDSVAAELRVKRASLRALIDIETSKIKIWTLRQNLFDGSRSTEQLENARNELAGLKRRVDQGLQYLSEIADEKTQTLVSLKDLLSNVSSPNEKAFYSELILQVNRQIENIQITHLEASRIQLLLAISNAEIDHWSNNQTLLEKTKNIWLAINETLQTIWHYELLAVDDTVVIDGREIKTKRSVTIGKSLGAIAILLIGFTLLSKLIRRMLALAVSKGSLNESRSAIMGRWLTLLAGITLIITAFNLVEIPLSAFAFFGGALAIGVGFGTQNLLKNLISGVMLLIEKPIRIGDVVEVDGVTGTVTSIGIRFSTLHSAHGTDTLIPNSVLVEQKLVNWTYSTADVRREIRVTVAYGSDVNLVNALMLKACEDLEQVLPAPAPVVTLEDLADNGLVFNLQVWLALQTGISVSLTLSKIRLAILAAFNEAGIELPYPQRVVHLKQD